jgi:penicillin-binding protein 1A
VRIFLAAVGLVLASAAGFLGGSVAVLARGLPQVSALEDFTPPSSTRVYAADGKLLAEFATERRTPVPLESLPPELIRAFLAIEDHRYFEHRGINLGRILKALAADVVEGRIVAGGSTITQQLAKVLFLTPEKTVGRKLREALLALEIERRYTKREILSLYLNQIYLGNGAYGVAAAAEVYFGKSVSSLDLAECALLAALPKAPKAYDPFRNPEKARARRALVLERLADLRWAELSATRAALGQPLPTPRVKRAIAPYFVEAVRRRLLERLGLDLVYEGGLRVYTTLDSRLQEATEEAVERQLSSIEKRHPRKGSPVQAAALAMDPESGAIRALVGGRNWLESPFDRSFQARRQPGSSFKPFVYLAALEQGWTQAGTLLDEPCTYPGSSANRPWKPANYDGTFMGRMTLRKALALSRNVPTIRLLEAVGKGNVDEMARRLGLAGPLGDGLASALGVGGTSLWELVRAYSALPTGGYLPEPHLIRAVYGPEGRNLWLQPAPARRVLDPVTAAIGADMLRAVVLGGTGHSARALLFPVGGKTGTTDDLRDAWFIGFSSRLAAGVWVGRDDNQPLGAGQSGAEAALPVWIEVMKASAAEGAPPPWPSPENLAHAFIDLDRGTKSPSGTPVAYAAFSPGTEPEESPREHSEPEAGPKTDI